MHIQQQLQVVIQQVQILLSQQQFTEVLALINNQPEQIKQQPQIKRIQLLILMKLQRFLEAKDIALSLLEDYPDQHDIKHNLAMVYRRLEDNPAAIEMAKSALALAPEITKYYLHLSTIYQQDKQILEAVDVLRQALVNNVDSQDLLFELTALLNSIYEYEEALTITTKIPPSFYRDLLRLESLINLNHYQSAKELVTEMLPTIDLTDQTRVAAFCDMLIQLGMLDAAREVLSNSNLQLNYELFRLQLVSGLYDAGTATKIFNSSELSNLSHVEIGNLQFEIARLHYQEGNFNEAFSLYQHSNNMHHPDPEYRLDIEQAFNTIKQTYAQLIPLQNKGSESNRPVFIVGMPRSGTTLLETIIAVHSQAFGAGETPYLNLAVNKENYFLNTHLTRVNYCNDVTTWGTDDYQQIAKYYLQQLNKRSTEALRIVDKLPHNFMHLGVINQLFPNAYIIHIKRNPIANCLSIYRENMGNFHAYGNDLNYLAEYYQSYESLMSFWQKNIKPKHFLEIHYEDLITNTEHSVKCVLAFLGLKYEAQCLEFHNSAKVVKTHSRTQVRNKIYTSSLQPWRGIEEHIKPLIDAFPDYI